MRLLTALTWLAALGLVVSAGGCSRSNPNPAEASRVPIAAGDQRGHPPTSPTKVALRPEGRPKVRPAISRPVRFGAGIAILPDPDLKRFLANVEKMKKNPNKEVFQPYRLTWVKALQAATGGEVSEAACRTALPLVAAQLDALWENDQLHPERINRYINRLMLLPSETVRTWKEELSKLVGPDSSVADLDTAGYLIQLDRLFTENTFRQDEAAALLVRLRSLKLDALKRWCQAIDTDPPQAAVMLIQDDLLFNQNQFQQPFFEELLREQKK